MKLVPLLLLPTLVLIGCGSGGSGTSDSGQIPDDGNTPGDGTNPDDDTNPGDDNNPAPDPDEDFAQQMLFAVNQARQQARDCGDKSMPAAPALTWSYDLESAAVRHSSDMANGNFLSHTGSDNSSVGDRISDTGYRASAWAENVAAGQKDIDAVMASWLSSPGHCENIMRTSVTELGAAFVENPDTTYGIYWTQVFAAPL
ncbi:CAP domain-containing protein [Vibrio sp. WXL103]|uniref:CAP domain-containing protein n=1 Tax=unclassified Vibrio TaxID=2614977 RepID=UPI003EC51261